LNSRFFRSGIITLLVVVLAVALAYTFLIQTPTQPAKGYSQFLTDVQQNKVTSQAKT